MASSACEMRQGLRRCAARAASPSYGTTSNKHVLSEAEAEGQTYDQERSEFIPELLSRGETVQLHLLKEPHRVPNQPSIIRSMK